MGRGLKAATDAYNSAVGSFETRVFPAGRKFKDLDVGVSGDIPEIGPVETTPRALAPFEALDGGEGHTAS
jgi:DNA recombination protein RmuC